METYLLNNCRVLILSNRETAREIRIHGGDQFAADALDMSANMIEQLLKEVTNEKTVL
jgi:hypothetical protein